MEKIIERNKYLEKIRPFYDSNYIKVITGIRRCGKSELLKQIIKEIKKNGVSANNIIYLDLESTTGTNIKTRVDLEGAIQLRIKNKRRYYIFIDEIQHIKDFEVAISSIRVSFNCSLFVTGSNSKLLYGKMQERLTGRAKEFEIYPFTYSEVLKYKQENHIEISKNEFDDYLKYGGMPQRFLETSEDDIRKYLVSLYQSIVKKDVYGTHKRINKTLFGSIAKYLINSTGHIFSSLSIAKYFKNDLPKDDQKKFSETVNNYARYLVESYLLMECYPFYLKGKEALKGTKKYYPVDVGLRNALRTTNEFDDTFALECIVYNELRYRGYDVRYGKLRNGELDFVVSRGLKKCMIQVSYKIEKQETYDREYGAFKNLNEHCPMYVMSLDKKDTSHDGITHLNVVDFLMGKVDISIS